MGRSKLRDGRSRNECINKGVTEMDIQNEEYSLLLKQREEINKKIEDIEANLTETPPTEAILYMSDERGVREISVFRCD